MRRILLAFFTIATLALGVGSAHAIRPHSSRHRRVESSSHRYWRFHGQRQQREGREVSDDFDLDQQLFCDTPGIAEPCATHLPGECAHGGMMCEPEGFYSECRIAVGPVREVCGDGLDNDCDGNVDNNCVCIPGSTMDCITLGIGICRIGEMRCNDVGTAWGDCEMTHGPGFESPNWVDDDCNGEVDDVSDE